VSDGADEDLNRRASCSGSLQPKYLISVPISLTIQAFETIIPKKKEQKRIFSLSPHPRTPEDTDSNLPTRAITSVANDVPRRRYSPSFYLAVNYQNGYGTYTVYYLDALGQLMPTTNDPATFKVYHISIRPDSDSGYTQTSLITSSGEPRWWYTFRSHQTWHC
jgi:hypothetical protein